MARKRTKEKLGRTCYPPAEVTAALGAFETTELTQAIRIAAQVLGQAAAEVSPVFSPAEWGQFAELLEGRGVGPGVPSPGPLLGDLAQKAGHRYGVAAPGDGKAKGGTLADRLRALNYPQA